MKELQFPTVMTLDEAFIRKVLWSSITHSWRKPFYIVCGVWYVLALVVIIASAVVTGDYSGLWKSLVIIAVVAVVLVIAWRTSINTGARRWKEQNHKLPATATIGFSDEGLVMQGEEGQNMLCYGDLQKVFEIDHVWVFRTKAGLLVAYNAAQLSETDRESVVKLLRQKNPGIRFKLKSNKV